MYRATMYNVNNPYAGAGNDYITTLNEPVVRNLQHNVNEYIARVLYYIDRLIQLIRSGSAYFEKYQSVIGELPTMYMIFKAFRQIAQMDQTDELEKTTKEPETDQHVKPTLFI